MTEKSSLEREIERHEMVRVPAGASALVIFLVLCLAALGFYAFTLYQENIAKDRTIRAVTFEKDALSNKLIRLERQLAKRESPLSTGNEIIEGNPGTSREQKESE